MLFETLRSLQAKGMAILFISHKLTEVRELCDTATILRGARSPRVDPRAHDNSDLARMMIGRDIPKVSAETEHRIGEARLVIDKLTLPSQTRFGTALRDVSLTVKAGQIVGIAGISGNGQAELAAAISGEVTAGEAGAITLMGKPVGRMSAAGRRRLGFAFIPEERLGGARCRRCRWPTIRC